MTTSNQHCFVPIICNKHKNTHLKTLNQREMFRIISALKPIMTTSNQLCFVSIICNKHKKPT